MKFESEKDPRNSLLVPFLYSQKNVKCFPLRIRKCDQLNTRITLPPKNQRARKNQNRHNFPGLAQDVVKSKSVAIDKDLAAVASSRT